jgi:hypothetical protein
MEKKIGRDGNALGFVAYTNLNFGRIVRKHRYIKPKQIIHGCFYIHTSAQAR